MCAVGKDIWGERPLHIVLDKVHLKLASVCIQRDLSVPFSSAREAEIAGGTLSIDKEPRRGGVQRAIQVQDNLLTVHFEAEDARTLRVSINSFFEHLKLVVQTIEAFGPPR